MKNKTKDILKNAAFYLSGPIENDKTDGVSWRQEFIKLLKDYKIKLEILDPTNKGKDSPQENIGEEREIMRNLKSSGKLAQVSEKMKKIRKFDLRCVDLADCIVVYIDKDIPTVGTWDEVFTAERQQKPILAIVKGGKRNAPDWSYRCVKHTEMFSSVEKCVQYIDKLNNGAKKLDDRWIIIRRSKA